MLFHRYTHLKRDLKCVPQLELNKARRVPLRGDAPEVRAIDVRVRHVPQHVIESVDQVESEFQPLFLRDRKTAQKVGVELVLAVAPQPIERRRENANVE